MARQVKEFRGEFHDVMVISELRGSYPNVPIAADVDYAALIAGDDNPMFVTLPIGKAGVTSGNKRHYDEAFVQELERQALANKPIGLMGHLSDGDKSTAFPREAVHWVGAMRDGDTLWGKAYVVPGPERERIGRYKAHNKAIATSIDAFAEGIWDESLGAHRMSAKSLRLNQIDIAPADRAGIPDLARVPVLTTEMDAAPSGSEEIQEPTTMDTAKAIQELINTKVAPQKGWKAPAREELPDLSTLSHEVTELRKQNEALTQAAIERRITELATDGIKVEAVRGMVTELVTARNPKTVQEAEAAYTEVAASPHVTELLKSTVQSTMGPRQTTRVQPQAGAPKYVVYPKEA